MSLTLFFGSCNDDCFDPTDPECENYDPCHNKAKTSAFFVIEEWLGAPGGVDGIWVRSDTIMGQGNNTQVRFRALQNADSFIWVVGSETIHSRSFIRNSFPANDLIPVKLIALNFAPSIACFPDDTGRDTMERMLTTWPNTSQLSGDTIRPINPMPIEGVYSGHFDSDPSEKVTVSLGDTSVYCSNSTPAWRISTNFDNIPLGYFRPQECSYFGGFGWIKRPTADMIESRIYRKSGYQSFDPDSIVVLNATAKLVNNKNVLINLEYHNINDESKSGLTKDKFYGTKIK
jgi:hypothetical protein